MTQIPAGDWLTLSEAATLIGVGKSRLSQVVTAGGIDHVRLGRQVMILRSVAVAFKKTKRPRGRPKKM